MVRPSAERKPLSSDNRHADLVAENARLRVAMCALEDKLVDNQQKQMDMQRDSIVRRQEFETLLADELSRAVDNIKTVISQRDNARQERDDARFNLASSVQNVRQERDDARHNLALSVQNLQSAIAQRDEARRLLHELQASVEAEGARFPTDSLENESASRERSRNYDDHDDCAEEVVAAVEEAKLHDEQPETARGQEASKTADEERAALAERASRREALLCSVVERLEANRRDGEQRHAEELLTATAEATAAATAAVDGRRVAAERRAAAAEARVQRLLLERGHWGEQQRAEQRAERSRSTGVRHQERHSPPRTEAQEAQAEAEAEEPRKEQEQEQQWTQTLRPQQQQQQQQQQQEEEMYQQEQELEFIQTLPRQAEEVEERKEDEEEEEAAPYLRQGVRFASVTLRNPMATPENMAATAASESSRGDGYSVDRRQATPAGLPQQDHASPASFFSDDDSFGEGTISAVSETVDFSLHQETTFSNTTASSYRNPTRASLGFSNQKEEEGKGDDVSSASTNAMQEDLDRTRRETERAVRQLLTHPWSAADEVLKMGSEAESGSGSGSGSSTGQGRSTGRRVELAYVSLWNKQGTQGRRRGESK